MATLYASGRTGTEMAALATEMTKIAHPFDQGQKGQKGIEW